MNSLVPSAKTDSPSTYTAAGMRLRTGAPDSAARGSARSADASWGTYEGNTAHHVRIPARVTTSNGPLPVPDGRRVRAVGQRPSVDVEGAGQRAGQVGVTLPRTPSPGWAGPASAW
ncbi:hypothetical protein GCM10028832_08610 [Streptomyces sparsus]